MKFLLRLAICGLLLTFTLAAQKVGYNFDDEADFSSYETFSWVKIDGAGTSAARNGHGRGSAGARRMLPANTSAVGSSPREGWVTLAGRRCGWNDCSITCRPDGSACAPTPPS